MFKEETQSWLNIASNIDKDRFLKDYKTFLEDQVFLYFSKVTIECCLKFYYTQNPGNTTKTAKADQHYFQSLLEMYRLIKWLIYRGIPIDEWGHLLFRRYCAKDLKDSEEDYKQVITTVFGERSPERFKKIPTFGTSPVLQEALPINYLNEEGIKVIGNYIKV